MRALVGALRLAVFLLSCGVTILIQSSVFLFTRGPFAYKYPRLYHSFLTRLLGIKVIVEGEIARGQGVVYVSNHISYMDIQVLGGLVHGAFVAKKEVESWPLFGIVGKMGQTMYVSRTPQHAARETKAMADRLDSGASLIIFAEGTSTDGTAVRPFKSSFFEMFLNRDIQVQPVTISVIEVDGRQAHDQATRDAYAWHGDMTLEPHLWSFVKGKGAVVKVVFHEPLASASFANRKQLSSAAEMLVAKGLDLSPVGP